jgi:hypothetical protein
MITKIDPPNFDAASSVQIDSDAGNPWLAIDEIETWAADHGFVRTSEYHPRVVLIDGRRRFRATCYRMSEEEVSAIEQAQQRMIDRGDAFRRAIAPPAASLG